MECLKEQFEVLLDAADPLHIFRKKAWDRFVELGEKIAIVQKVASSPIGNWGVANSSLLFVDGFFQNADLLQPLVCLPLDEAMRRFAIFLQHRLMHFVEKENQPMALLNGALQGRGAFLYVPPNVQLDQPIVIEHRINSFAAAFPCLHVFVGKGASIKILQKISCCSGASFCNAYLDAVLDAGASVSFCSSQKNCPAKMFCFARFTLKKDSFLHAFSTCSGERESVSSMQVQLAEEGSKAVLQGLYTLDANAKHSICTAIEHIAPQCCSHQHFKSVLGGESAFHFEGNILVRAEAQKTKSYQLCQNLLLSDKAFADVQPNLNICADDVQASHGVTISQIKENELFYLNSRGLSTVDAKKLLVEGFCKNLLSQAPSWYRSLGVHA